MNAHSAPQSYSPQTVPCLSPHVTAMSIADASRNAWRVFIEQSEGWSKAELVLWCGGLYAPIARHGAPFVDGLREESDDDYENVDPHFIERMIETARGRAITALSSFGLPRARLDFAREMSDEGAATRCQDRFGAVAFAPTPATNSLTDRVLSLIAADLFARPGDFEGETLCSCCGGVVMGPSPCCSHYDGRNSGYVTRTAATAQTIAVPLAG